MRLFAFLIQILLPLFWLSEDTGEATRASVVNQILSCLDGVNSIPNVLMIGLTNRRELLDEALLRPGRLEGTSAHESLLLLNLKILSHFICSSPTNPLIGSPIGDRFARLRR